MSADLLPAVRRRRSRWLLLVLLAFAAVLAFAFQGGRGLWGPDEGRYANTALQMLDSGDFLVPRRSAEHPQFSKPPLTYWAIAASVTVFGRNEWALRLPSALAFCLTVAFVLSLSRRLTPHQTWHAPVVYATTLAPFVAVNLFVTDVLAAMFLALAGFGFVRVWHAADAREAWRGRLLLALGFGCAFLTRGVLTLLPLLPMFVFARSTGLLRFKWICPWSVLIFLLLSLPWYVQIAAVEPELFLPAIQQALLGDTGQGGWDEILGGYLPLLALGGLPWTFVLFLKSRDLRMEWHKLGIARYRAVHQERYFLWLWLLLPVLALLVLHPGDPLFLFPCFVPFALLVARELQRRDFNGWAQIGLALWVLALLTVKGVAANMSHPKDARVLAEVVTRSLTFIPRQVVFFEEPALYGVRYYLGAPVARVSAAESDDPRVDAVFKDFVRDGVAEQVWITLLAREQVLLDIAHQNGLSAKRRAVFGRYAVFELSPSSRN